MTNCPSIVAVEGPVDVLARAKLGEETAFEELMRMHERQVLRTAFRLLGRIEDAQMPRRRSSCGYIASFASSGRCLRSGPGFTA